MGVPPASHSFPFSLPRWAQSCKLVLPSQLTSQLTAEQRGGRLQSSWAGSCSTKLREVLILPPGVAGSARAAAQPQGTASDVTISFFLVCPAALSTASSSVMHQCGRSGNRHLYLQVTSCLTLGKSLRLFEPSRFLVSVEHFLTVIGGTRERTT